MKTLKIIAVLLFLSFKSYGQFIVHDPGATAEAIKHSTEAIKQTKEIARQTEIASKALEKLEQVNSLLQNAKLIMGIKNNITATSQMLEETPRLISKVNSPKLKNALLEQGSNIMMDTSILQELIIATIKPKALSMTDGERLKTLMDLYNQSKILRNQVGVYRYKIFQYIH